MDPVSPKDELSEREITPDSIRKQAELISMPIDFEQLAADGILVKRGHRYQVLDASRIPEHVKARIQSILTNSTGKMYVTFARTGKRLKKR